MAAGAWPLEDGCRRMGARGRPLEKSTRLTPEDGRWRSAIGGRLLVAAKGRPLEDSRQRTAAGGWPW